MNKFFAILLLAAAGLACVPIFAKNNSSQMRTQQTLSIIKPEVVVADKVGPIIANIEAAGLHVIAIKMTWLTKDQAAIFYAVHRDRPFYKSLVEFMSSGPIIAMVLEGDNSIEAYRKLMGATDPAKALPGTLRKEFGTNVDRNAVHGSDSPENAKKEIAFFFTDGQIYPRNK